MSCGCGRGWCAERPDCRIALRWQRLAAGAKAAHRVVPRRFPVPVAHPITEWTLRVLKERRQELIEEIECLKAGGLGSVALLRLLRVKRAALGVVERAIGRLEHG